MPTTFNTTAASAPAPSTGVQFDLVPIIGDPAKAVLQVAFLAGVPTRHGDARTDRGRLYGSIAPEGGGYRLNLYALPSRAGGSMVATGLAPAVGAYFDISQANASGITGQARLASYAAPDPALVLFPTFAVDSDVVTIAGQIVGFPGYDADAGLAPFHAAAMREILADYLPAAVPHLYGGDGLAEFVKHDAAAAFPDLRKLASAEQLRVAQASLAKALSAEQGEHLEEWALVAKLARERFAKAMERLALSNTVDEEVAVEDSPSTVSVGTFRRG